MSRFPPLSGLYGIADAGFGDPVKLGRALLDGGVCALQLRCKGWSEVRVVEALRALRPLCRDAGVPLIVNDHAELLHLADGVHLGQGDGPLPRVRGKLRGRSTHDLAQLREARVEGADYVGFGPVFTTGTKVGALPARGVPALQAAVQVAGMPVVAIGGISADNLGAVRATGVPCWTAIGAVLGAPDVAAAARRLGA